MEHEALRVLQVVQKSARCRDEQVYALLELVCFLASFRAADDHTMCLSMVLKAVLGPLVIVHGELSGRGDDQHSRPLLRSEVRASQHFDSRNHVGQRFTAACLCRTEHVPTIENVRNGPSLDLCGLLEAKAGHCLLCLV